MYRTREEQMEIYRLLSLGYDEAEIRVMMKSFRLPESEAKRMQARFEEIRRNSPVEDDVAAHMQPTHTTSTDKNTFTIRGQRVTRSEFLSELRTLGKRKIADKIEQRATTFDAVERFGVTGRVTTRSIRATEIRSASGNQIQGHIAIFDSPADLGDFTERLARGCFRSSLNSGRDIVALQNHDDGRPLGRTSRNTLKLCEDSQGLAFSLDLPNNSYGNDVREAVQRGDASGCSFGFICTDDDWNLDSSNNVLRTIRDLTLHEVSVGVTFPAYAAAHSVVTA
jgi:HK97 family phage prohead protease